MSLGRMPLYDRVRASNLGFDSVSADVICVGAKQLSDKPKAYTKKISAVHTYGKYASIKCILKNEQPSAAPHLHRKESVLAGTDVVTLDTYKVHQAVPTKECWIHLSHFDIVMPDHDILACFLYVPQPALPFERVVTILRTSLAEALVTYYPLAGMLILKENESPSILHCNDSGVEFEEASTEARFDNIDYFQPNHFEHLSPRKRVSSNGAELEEGIPFSVKVTRFRCGGIALGCRFHHMVVDTSSVVQFLVGWSRISRGLGVLKQAFHHRSLVIKARDPPFPNVAQQQYIPVKRPPRLVEGVDARLYYVSKHMMNELKKQAQADAYSSLTAFFWRASVRARKVSLQQQAHMFTVADGRRVLDVPAGLFGNVLGRGVADAEVGALLSQPLEEVARVVRESVAGIDKESLQSFVDLVETRRQQLIENKSILSLRRGRKHGDCMLSSSLLGFPFYKIDFGWGVPSFVNMSSSRTHPGFMYLSPTPPWWGGGLIACIQCFDVTQLDLDHELADLARTTTNFLGQLHKKV